MSFEQPEQLPKWPKAGSEPEIGQDVRFRSVENSEAKRPDAWTVMGLSEVDGATMVEVWHSYEADKFAKEQVLLEELRRLNSAR